MPKVPFPHQIEGANYLKNRGSGFLYMQQRTGKTLTSILALKADPAQKVLIITKKTVLPVWRDELILESWNEQDVQIIEGTKKQRIRSLENPQHKVYICNYDMLINYRVFKYYVWDTIIFDESSTVANGSAKVTRYCLRAVEQCRKENPKLKVYALSGNPAPESPMQYASQFLLVDGVYFGYTDLPSYIFDNWEKSLSGKWKPKKKEHVTEIEEKIVESCFVKRMDELGLGSKILRHKVMLPMNKKQVHASLWVRAKIEGYDKETQDKLYANYMNQVGAGIHPDTKEIINDNKLQYVIDYFLDHKDPIVVLGHFKRTLYALKDLAKDKGLSVEIITGDTPSVARESIRQDFQRGLINILLCQEETVKMGTDLSKSCTTFFISNNFSGDTRDQVEYRTTNVCKTDPVHIIDLCTKNTLDEAIVDLLRNKEKISYSTLCAKSRTYGD